MATGNLLSIRLEGGFIGQTANNGQQIIDAKTNKFSKWGIVSASFEQFDDGSGEFTKQGNNVPGFLAIRFADGSVYKVKGEIDGVEKDNGKVELITFLALEDRTIPTPNGPLVIKDGTNEAGTNFALDLFGSEIEFKEDQFLDVDKDGDKDDIQGSADLQSALGALNDQLSKQVSVLLVGDIVVEGSAATISANVEKAPDTDFTINLNNGQSIIIKEGETSGFVTFNVQSDDPYIDPELSEIYITSTTGGEYYFVDIQSITELVVKDTINETTVNVTTADASEADDTVIFNFELSNPPQSGYPASIEVEVGGQTYTVQLDSDGKGSLDVANPNAEDVYKDPSALTATVTAINGGNFEATSLDGASATAQISDTNNATSVNVTTADASEADDTVIFNFELSNPPQSGYPASIEVEVGGQTYTVQLDSDGKGSLDVANPNAEDVYKDPSALTATVTAINGGNFEATSLDGASATAQISDTNDATIVNLVASENRIEIGKAIEISASVASAVTGSNLEFTLNDGSVLTIAVGAKQSNILVVTPITSGQKTLFITNYVGGNFEDLITTDTISFEVVEPASYGGLSHGYWKTHGEDAPGKQSNDWDPVTGAAEGNFDGEGGDSFETLFGLKKKDLSWSWTEGKGKKSNKINASDISFSQALALTGSGQNRLAREATAAVLNARDEDVNYRFTEEKVINSTYNALISGDAQTISNLATIFENQNTLGL